MLHPRVSRTLLWSPLAAMMIAAAPGAAIAAGGDATLIRKSTAVRISDLKLNLPADAATAYRRIRRAAERVCGDGLAGGAPLPPPPQWDCVRHAVADAVSSLNRPALTAEYLRYAGSAVSRTGA